jgi:hypothetical protein
MLKNRQGPTNPQKSIRKDASIAAIFCDYFFSLEWLEKKRFKMHFHPFAS